MTNGQTPGPSASAAPGDQGNEISILGVLVVLAKHKLLIVAATLIAGIAAALVSLQMTEMYTGTAKLLPPQAPSSAGSLISQIGQLGTLAGGALGIKSPSDVYVGMLKSRTIADALVDRFKLMEVYQAKRRSEARSTLEKSSQIVVGKDGLITLEVEDADPKRAAELANAYVEELEKLSSILAVTEAGQRRLFFERQLNQAKENLLKAELGAQSAIAEGGLAGVDAQGRTLLQSSASLRARVTAKEVELNFMRGFSTEQNPQFNRVQQELAALRSELLKLEGGQAAGKEQRSSDRGVKNVALLREVRYQEVLFELLARQYELAKVDEARDARVVQVLDKAIEPDRRSRPQRTVIVILSMAAACMASILLAFILEAIERARSDPLDGVRFNDLRRYLLRWR